MRTIGCITAWAAVAACAAGCGLPADGGPDVEDATVPYNLLDERPAPGDGSVGAKPPPTGPRVFWVDDEGMLVPRAVTGTCPADVASLVAELSAGPTQQVRDRGLATALPPDSKVELVRVGDDAVVVDLETDTQINAERLPLAIGQVVLTLSTAAGIDQVSLLSNGESVQIPDADGALVTTPVTAEAYAPLVPAFYRQSPPFRGETADDDECRTTS